MTDQHASVSRFTYAGLFLVAMATLMFEILLTRIFSATTWYHFAFMAVSVAMFGMTAGAISVYLRPRRFPVAEAPQQLARASLAFALAIPACFLIHLCIPFDQSLTVTGVTSFLLTYLVVAAPFYFSGVAICLALTRFPRRVSSLYAADLAGAGIGCMALLYTLKIGNGPSAVLVVAALAALGAACFALAQPGRRLRNGSLVALVVLSGCAFVHAREAREGDPPIRVKYVKGITETPPLYETWNSFSRITVRNYLGLEDKPGPPFGWGISQKVRRSQRIKQLSLFIDGMAGTVLTNFDGDTSKIQYLKHDVTNIAHYLRQDASVLVVGVGGGRDLLSALAFDQRQVLGVELNEDILTTVNEEYGEFTGHLDQHPKVRIVNDEARSYIARSDEQVDLLQISLIDTWAATAAGAFVLAENALYTLDSWRIFLEHLTPEGLLTTSRWYTEENPAEAYRMVSLAVAALEDAGVSDPAQHLALVSGAGVGNLIVGKAPLTAEEIHTLRGEAETLGFEVILAHGEAADPILQRLAAGEQVRELPGGIQLDLSAPTDDRPFFFNMVRLRDVFFGNEVFEAQGHLEPNVKAVKILALLLLVVAVLTALCIVLPLVLTTNKGDLAGTQPLFLFFASIGVGFLLIELSQMHRLILVLGHPTYGLSVVLFALLLSSGLGSLLTQRMKDVGHSGLRVLIALLGTLVAFGVLTPLLAEHVETWSTPMRISAAVASLFPMGLLMGMAFPLGLRLSAERSEKLLPWFWGINGATSVLSSVLATGLSLTFSISTTFWVGAGCYVVALVAFAWARQRGLRAAA